MFWVICLRKVIVHWKWNFQIKASSSCPKHQHILQKIPKAKFTPKTFKILFRSLWTLSCQKFRIFLIMRINRGKDRLQTFIKKHFQWETTTSINDNHLHNSKGHKMNKSCAILSPHNALPACGRSITLLRSGGVPPKHEHREHSDVQQKASVSSHFISIEIHHQRWNKAL